MAPLCADPRQIVIALNPEYRRALLDLVDEITLYMISQLKNEAQDLGPVTLEDSPEQKQQTSKDSKDENENKSSEETQTEDLSRSQTSKTQDAKSKNQASEKANKQAQRIQRAALKHISSWKAEFMPKLDEIVKVEDTDAIKTERENRRKLIEKEEESNEPQGSAQSGNATTDEDQDISSLESLYQPIPSMLSTMQFQDRREAISCVLLLLLASGKYSAHSRALAMYLASALQLSPSFVNQEETEIAKSLLEQSTADQSKKDEMSAEAEAAKRRQDNKFNRFWKVGLASVAGATLIGVTGGLAAPLVAGALGSVLGGVGLGGVASFLGIFWMNGALVGALFGAYGAKMTGEMMDKYAKEVEDFKFIPLHEDVSKTSDSKDDKEKEKDDRRLRLTIGINGWLNTEEDITNPWRVLPEDTEVFALRYEVKTLLKLGTAFQDLVRSFAWKAFKSEVIKRTVLATLWAALWPIQLFAVASNVDNPFSHASNRSRKAGELLADALINRVQGERPVTLIGYSLGATAIHACLQSLAERQAFGLIDTVVIMGTPAPSAPAHWRTLRTVVSGKIFNVYSENDMILGWVYRMHSLALGVAGLQAIEAVEGVENLNLSDRVSGHLRYPELTGEILKRCGFIDIQAADEIEKDDVIKMKDEQREGGEGVDSVDMNEGQQTSHKATEDGDAGGTADAMKDLKLSSARADLEGLSLPPRPDEIDDTAEPTSQSIAAKPSEIDNISLPPRPDEIDDQDEAATSGPQHDKDSQEPSEAAPALPRRPAEAEKLEQQRVERKPVQPARPRPSSADESNEGAGGGIVMLDHESDDGK